MKKLSKILATVLVIAIIAITVLSLTQKTNGVSGVSLGKYENITTVDDLNWFAATYPEDFVDTEKTPYTNLINRTMSMGVAQISENPLREMGLSSGGITGGGVYYNNGVCLYHTTSSYANGDQYIIVNVIDFDIVNGEYQVTSYHKDGSVKNVTRNKYLADLASAIYYVDRDGAEGRYTYGYNSRKPVYYYFHQVIEAIQRGEIEDIVDYKFRDAIDNSVNINGYREVIDQEGTSMSSYKELTKQEASESAKAITVSDKEAIIGPFRVSYEGNGVSGVTIDGVPNANVKWSKTSNNESDWKEISTSNEESSIPNNTDFYLKVSADLRNIENIKVKFAQESLKYYKARLVLLRSDLQAGEQNLGMFVGLENKKETTIEYDVKNVDQTISIAGYVWVDQAIKGEAANDNVYKDQGEKGDYKLGGVTVSLIKKGENAPANGFTTKTLSDGSYKFNEIIKYSQLDNYYVQFDYAGMTIEQTIEGVTTKRAGKEYIPVAYNSADISKIVSNGSRAMLNSIPVSDEDLSVQSATTYKGTDSRYGLKALAEKLYDSGTHTLANINLGIKPIYMPEYQLTEDIRYVKLVLNNHEYFYEYGGKVLQNVEGAAKVQYESGSKIGYYRRGVSPSAIYDLIERGEPEDGTIKLYVVYQMVITNTNHRDDVYAEDSLHITSLTNEFDTSRYEISTVKSSAPDKLEVAAKGDFDKWTVDGNKATYKDNDIVVGAGKQVSKYIQFKVNKDEIVKILANEDGVQESRPTTAKTIGYHTYTRDDYSWNYMPNLPKANAKHQSVKQSDEDSAPYLRFVLGEERVIQGFVFEDNATTNANGDKLGNGKKEDGEKNVSGVKVELLLENGNIAKLYVADQKDKTKYKMVDAIVNKTADNGEYRFEGLMPGKYYVRFTYGDETNYSIEKYKSTIVTSKVAMNALGYSTNQHGDKWYQHIEGTNYSVAIDNLDTRSKYNMGDNTIKSMTAQTPVFDITIENSSENSTQTFEGFNLGIVIQPIQKVELSKNVTDLKLTNNQHVFAEGNPETANIPGVTDLDGIKNNGSSYVRMEIEESSIYGSELILTYTIEVKNISEKNYYEIDSQHYGWYYKFGLHDASYSREVETKLESILDCYDPTLTISNSDRITQLTYDSTKKTWGDRAIDSSVEAQQNLANSKEEGKYNYTNILSINGWDNLGKEKSASVTVQMKKLLSTSDNDLDFINAAGVGKSKVSVANSDKTNADANKSIQLVPQTVASDPTKAEVTVTTPTGSDKQENALVYPIAGIGILIAIASGVIILRRKK